MHTKVLIGEDNLVTQQVLKAMLESKNCEVTVVSTYEHLISQLQNSSFTFLLLDYHLDQDADFVLGKIQDLTNDNNALPVYIMSAGRKEDVMEKLSAYKIDGFLKKPIENDQLDTLPLNPNAIPSDANDRFLKSIIGDNPNRIKAINDFFLTEVPPALADIGDLLQKKDFAGAKKLVHRIRPAYTYVGKDDIQIRMGVWENDLMQGNNEENYEIILDEVNQETEKLIATFSTNHPKGTTSPPQQKIIDYPQLNGLKILIVDDNQVILSVFTSLLQSHKVIVHTAKDGAMGVSETLSNRPDLILMDIQMPGMDGVDAISAIREKGIKTPIIAISNAIGRENEAISAGATQFLQKPVDARDLIAAITTGLHL